MSKRAKQADESLTGASKQGRWMVSPTATRARPAAKLSDLRSNRGEIYE